MKILISAILALFLVGCSSESKEETQDTSTQSITQSAKELKSEAEQEAQEPKEEVVEKAQEAKEAVSQKTQEAKEAVSQKTQEVKEAVVAKTKEIEEAVTAPKVDAAKMYQVCAACHGPDASKPALGKSQIIKGWDAKKIADSLHGYKDGTYGGAMKGIMVGQVSKLSEDEIEALAEYISKL
ncbi:MAG: c-type cytochrome [Sulfurimonas sp.]|uniref:c-type cytochrome n=1 Tax=Sulfurimonas sp. TaxID=2022749 RepID=UPI0026009FDB|nr:c-type cytochrome [Sulfurimonas sp.]MCK9454165.1 c-type cytochrome [Sulfurimonas sp.]